MYKLQSVPIFQDFLDLFFKKVGSKIKIKKSNKLFLYDKCVCGDDNCNSFILKSINRIGKDFYTLHTIYTNKGTFQIELYDNGIFVFVATENDNFPFKDEFRRMFKNYKKTVRRGVLPYHNTKPLSIKDKQKLHRFFYDFEVLDDCYKLDECLDNVIKDYL